MAINKFQEGKIDQDTKTAYSKIKRILITCSNLVTTKRDELLKLDSRIWKEASLIEIQHMHEAFQHGVINNLHYLH